MPQLVAFLRGINLGRRRIKMDDLRAAFEDLGFSDVHTLLASGNVLFEGQQTIGLAGEIEAGLREAFGFEVPTILRSVEYLTELAASDPFQGFEAGPDTKLYVFFLARPESQLLPLPYAAPGDFEVTGATEREIFAAAYRMESGRFGPGLDTIGKPFGAGVTNRNWNTVLRILSKAQG